MTHAAPLIFPRWWPDSCLRDHNPESISLNYLTFKCSAGNLLICRKKEKTAIPLVSACFYFCMTFDVCSDTTLSTFVVNWADNSQIAIEPHILLGAIANDVCNPFKIFKMASNSFLSLRYSILIGNPFDNIGPVPDFCPFWPTIRVWFRTRVTRRAKSK